MSAARVWPPVAGWGSFPVQPAPWHPALARILGWLLASERERADETGEMRAIASGDSATYARLIDRESPRLLRFARGLLGAAAHLRLPALEIFTERLGQTLLARVLGIGFRAHRRNKPQMTVRGKRVRGRWRPPQDRTIDNKF